MKGPLRNIVFPTDFSVHSEGAIKFAAAFAKHYGATVHLLHAIPCPKDLRMSGGWWALLHAEALRGLNKFTDQFEAEGVSFDTQIVNDDPTAATLELARKTEADLIVMGSLGRSGLDHVLLGSVAERIIRLAPCPVLTSKS